MLLRHENPNTGTVALSTGETFEVGDKGLFDVPEDDARWLLAHQPGWRIYTGTDESEADRAASLEADNRELRRRLAEVEAGAVKAAATTEQTEADKGAAAKAKAAAPAKTPTAT
jgi:hypothetical protein